MNLADKLKILDLLKQGEKVGRVSQKLNVNESTIRSIRDNAAKICGSTKQLEAHAQALKITRSATSEKMEDMLLVWIQDLVHKRISLSSMAIREQALIFHEYLSRSLKFKCECEIALQPYKDLYKSLSHLKQTRIDNYFRK